MAQAGESSTNRRKTSMRILNCTAASSWIPQVHTRQQLVSLFNGRLRAGTCHPTPGLSTHAGRPVFAGSETLDVPEAMELLGGVRRQKVEGRTCQRLVGGFGCEVASRTGRLGTDMNGALL